MREKKLIIVNILIALLLLASCASYKSSLIKSRKVKLTENTLDSFEGNFEFYYYAYCVTKDSIWYPLTDGHNNLLNSLNRTYNDSTDLAYCKCSFPNRNLFSIQCYNENDSCFLSQDFEGKLKSNGFFNLKNQYFKIDRIPFLFGGWNHSKTRIGITNDNELLIQSATDNWGAILVLFGAGISFNKVTYFEKYNSNSILKKHNSDSLNFNAIPD